MNLNLGDCAFISAVAVAQACERYMADVIEWKDKELEDLISEKMNRKFFPAKSREEAISSLKGEFTWQPVEYKYRNSYRMAEDLMNLARAAVDIGDGKVLICRDTMGWLKKYINVTNT